MAGVAGSGCKKDTIGQGVHGCCWTHGSIHDPMIRSGRRGEIPVRSWSCVRLLRIVLLAIKDRWKI
jgi:hypothetical protein